MPACPCGQASHRPDISTANRYVTIKGKDKGQRTKSKGRNMRTITTLALVVLATAVVPGQGRPHYVAERTPWGHPDLQGTYSNDDETGTPMERPAQFEGRTHESLTTEELRSEERRAGKEWGSR